MQATEKVQPFEDAAENVSMSFQNESNVHRECEVSHETAGGIELPNAHLLKHSTTANSFGPHNKPKTA